MFRNNVVFEVGIIDLLRDTPFILWTAEFALFCLFLRSVILAKFLIGYLKALKCFIFRLQYLLEDSLDIAKVVSSLVTLIIVTGEVDH